MLCSLRLLSRILCWMGLGGLNVMQGAIVMFSYACVFLGARQSAENLHDRSLNDLPPPDVTCLFCFDLTYGLL